MTAPPAGPVLFVGLGAMGTPMASSLARAGHELLLRDVDDTRARALAAELAAEAVTGDGMAAAGARARTVVLMLPDSAAVEAVLLGDDGLFAQLPSDALVVDMSSSRPSSTVAVAARAAEVGLAYVDAPVSGGVSRARRRLSRRDGRRRRAGLRAGRAPAGGHGRQRHAGRRPGGRPRHEVAEQPAVGDRPGGGVGGAGGRCALRPGA